MSISLPAPEYPADRSSDKPARRWLHLPIWLFLALLMAAFWWHILGLISQDRTRTITDAEGEIVNLARLSQEHVERTFYSADQLLRTIRYQYEEHGEQIDLGRLMNSGAFDRNLFPQIAIIDAQGMLRFNSAEFKAPIDLSDREHFKVHVASSKDELFISRPVLGRASGKWTIQFTRRITRQGGGFGGVVVASLDPSYFTRFYNDLAIGSTGVAALYRTDGWLFARKSAKEISYQAVNTASGPIFTSIAQGAMTGTVTSRSIVDGLERTYHFRKLPRYEAIVTIGRGTAEMLLNHEQTRQSLIQEAALASLFLILAGVLASSYLAIRQRRAIEQTQSEERYRILIDWAPDAIAVQRDGLLQYVNPAAVELFGASKAQDLIGRPAIIMDAATPIFEKVMHKLDGTPIEVEVKATPIRYDGMPAVLVALRDITERKKLEDQVRAMAFHDPLTGLPNRRLLGDRLSLTMAICRRTGRRAALMFVDLDNFKLANDAHGHQAGDLLLLEVARRLNGCVREVDTIARFGGDEFVVLLSDLRNERTQASAQVVPIAEKVRLALQEPYRIEVEQQGVSRVITESRISASLGVVMFGDSAMTQDDLFGLADAAMYRAKEAGRNTVCFHEVARAA